MKTIILWADYDPVAPRGSKWAFYNTKAEQRSNRPDLKPIRLKAFSEGRRAERRGKKSSFTMDVRQLAMLIAETMVGVNDPRAIKALRTAKVIRKLAEQEFLAAGGNKNELYATIPAIRPENLKARRGKK